MHHMCSPQHADLVWKAVKPIVEEIDTQQQQYPGIPGLWNGGEAIIFIYPDVDTDIQDFQQDTRYLLHDTGIDIADGIIHAVQMCFLYFIYDELNDDEYEKSRDGINDEWFHVFNNDEQLEIND